MRLLVDGIFFQINNTGIARVWRTILSRLVSQSELEIFMLDRGGLPLIEGVTYIPFPTNLFIYCAEDSVLIQRICDQYRIDVFTSTYFSTPLSTPMLLMVYDMIPELFDFEMSELGWLEKDTAICFAQRYVCISENTRNDLLSFYPEINENFVSVAHCGVDSHEFSIRSDEEVTKFRRFHGLDRPYFLFVGSRVQHNGYKNSKLFFDAVASLESADFDVLCVGGEKKLESQLLDSMPAGVRCMRLELSDLQLSLAYNGALALVYPSLYEGFGMPVIEAMASGCPVITTSHGSLLEAAGDAACFVSGFSVDEMRGALSRVRDPAYRDKLKMRGLEHVKRFNWNDMAEQVVADLFTLHHEAKRGEYKDFLKEWRRLRELQTSVVF